MVVGSIGSSPSSAVVTDPRDLNQDGKVTEAELQQYARKHPDPKPLEKALKEDGNTVETTRSSSLMDLTV